MMELDGRSVTADELARLALYNYGHFTTMRVDAVPERVATAPERGRSRTSPNSVPPPRRNHGPKWSPRYRPVPYED